MSSCRESSFRKTGAETRIRAKADNCWRNASWSKTRPASCGTSIVTVNAAISFAFLYNSRCSTILYRLGPFGIPRLLSSPGRDAPVACEVLPVSGDATSRRVHELGRWLTPMPSTEVKDQIRAGRIVGDLAQPPPKNDIILPHLACDGQEGNRADGAPHVCATSSIRRSERLRIPASKAAPTRVRRLPARRYFSW